MSLGEPESMSRRRQAWGYVVVFFWWGRGGLGSVLSSRFRRITSVELFFSVLEG